MDADGSDRRPLAEGVLIEHILGSPNIAWSPDGTRIAYATVSDARDQSADLERAARRIDPGPRLRSTADTAGRHGWPGARSGRPTARRIAFRYDPDLTRRTWLIANADGTGDVHEIDELQSLGWRGGWYFCECYG